MSRSRSRTPDRPAPNEYAAFYAPYLAAIGDEPLDLLLDEQPGRLRRITTPLSEAVARRGYAPGKWSVRQVIGHLVDAERVFSYRMLRFARGDRTPLPGFDENAYVEAGGFDARETRELVEEFAQVRKGTVALAASLSEECWHRGGEASGAHVTVRALLWITAGHTEHHLRVLRERYGLSG
jgi:hypothetical protein